MEVPASEIEAIYYHQHFQESKEGPTIWYCITLQETQMQQLQRIIRKILMKIRNLFIKNLLILLLTPSKIDLINQDFKLFTQAEQLFLKVRGRQDVTGELKVMETHFKGDYDADSLTSELQLLPTIFEGEPINMEEIVKVL